LKRSTGPISRSAHAHHGLQPFLDETCSTAARCHNQSVSSFAPFPAAAAWRHVGSRDGFEVASFERTTDGWLVRGMTAADEGSEVWAVRYEIKISEQWLTQSAHVVTVSSSGERMVTLNHDGRGNWLVNDLDRPDLEGCLDVDLESSAMTNTFPVHRLPSPIGARQETPATYVRAAKPEVERLEQHYTRLDDSHHFYYEAPAFEFTAELSYDTTGLIVDYPSLARRAH
jgi:hypothetical protein